MLHHTWQLPATKRGLLGRKATGIIYHYNRITPLCFRNQHGAEWSREAYIVYRQKKKKIKWAISLSPSLIYYDPDVLRMPGASAACQIARAVIAGGWCFAPNELEGKIPKWAQYVANELIALRQWNTSTSLTPTWCHRDMCTTTEEGKIKLKQK